MIVDNAGKGNQLENSKREKRLRLSTVTMPVNGDEVIKYVHDMDREVY